MQDFTGVPCVVDLAAMREAVQKLGGNPEEINPLNPPSWSSTTPCRSMTTATQLARQQQPIEFERNGERYAFLRWGQTAFRNFKVVPPNTGIVTR
jgi:aconitate hydratase